MLLLRPGEVLVCPGAASRLLRVLLLLEGLSSVVELLRLRWLRGLLLVADGESVSGLSVVAVLEDSPRRP